MAAITISRQMGSLGADVAQIVAERLGYHLAWKEIINQAAHRSGEPEVALAAIDELGLLDLCPSPQACLDYQRAVQQVLIELAEQGNVVIVGRAGQAVLHNYPDVMHVRIIASPEVRARRIAHIHGIALAGAFNQIEASDEYRRQYLDRYYDVSWDDPDLYDLVINTGRLDSADAAELVVVAFQRWLEIPPGQVDPDKERQFEQRISPQT